MKCVRSLYSWLGGPTTAMAPSVYGQFRTPSAAAYPGGRWGHSMVIDQSNNLVL